MPCGFGEEGGEIGIDGRAAGGDYVGGHGRSADEHSAVGGFWRRCRHRRPSPPIQKTFLARRMRARWARSKLLCT